MGCYSHILAALQQAICDLKLIPFRCYIRSPPRPIRRPVHFARHYFHWPRESVNFHTEKFEKGDVVWVHSETYFRFWTITDPPDRCQGVNHRPWIQITGLGSALNPSLYQWTCDIEPVLFQCWANILVVSIPDIIGCQLPRDNAIYSWTMAYNLLGYKNQLLDLCTPCPLSRLLNKSILFLNI